jgi:uncharacterized HAD superfamily protein
VKADGSDSATDFLLDEYGNIAQAHFKTIELISAFFKHYLLIMSVPVTIGVALLKVAGLDVSAVGPAALIVFALAGGSLFWYVANLRMDAVLYARTINALRKHFFDRLDVDLGTALLTRVLPQSQSQPPYHEIAHFYPVVIAFGLINSAYVAAAVYVGAGMPADLTGLGRVLVVVMCLGMAAHLGGYALIAWHRGTRYLKSGWIGVDLDGVVNDHTSHFCDALARRGTHSLRPGQITRIPVHECAGLGVTRFEEKEVFNDLAYWTAMPPMDGAADGLRRLQGLNYRLVAFTRRGWPDLGGMSEAEIARLTKEWNGAASDYVRFSARCGKTVKSRRRLMEAVTKRWLDVNDFPEMPLIVEEGTETVGDTRLFGRNRYHESKHKRIRFFIEDDPDNAFKLAHVCDVVFLIDQPYNQTGTWAFPRNVLRVQSWEELYRYARALS